MQDEIEVFFFPHRNKKLGHISFNILQEGIRQDS